MDFNNLDREWKILQNTNINFTMPMMDFWKCVKNMKYSDTSEIFLLTNEIVEYVLILPHSSAAVERTFSDVNLNKNKTRNRLSTETLSGILYAKYILNAQEKSCFDFDISDEMIKYHKTDMYK